MGKLAASSIKKCFKRNLVLSGFNDDQDWLDFLEFGSDLGIKKLFMKKNKTFFLFCE